MTNQFGNGWTDVRVAMLKKLQIEGLSCRKIAAALGNITKNSVIGKLRRMGLSNGIKTGPRKSKEPKPLRLEPFARTRAVCHWDKQPKVTPVRRDPKSIAERREHAEQLRAEFACNEIIDLTPEQSATKCTLMELNRHTCRWPLGNPSQEDFGFCGAEPIDDRPYCAPHCRIAYRVRVSRETEIA
jgi:GcrA cell cycle regulator